MRALIISDVHGNLAALDAVLAEPHDVLICLGDIVGYGPEPGACARRLFARADLVLRGNHDQALATGGAPECQFGLRWLAEATAGLGAAQLSAREQASLAELPVQASRTIDGVRYSLVHATPRDPLHGHVAPVGGAWADEVRELDADVVVVGHTHVQFRIAAGGRRILNPGSVGQPRDGDPRAAYAVIEDGTISLCRAAYPVERTVAALERSGIDSAAVAVLTHALRTGRTPLADARHGFR